jgi:hypothetical protein
MGITNKFWMGLPEAAFDNYPIQVMYEEYFKRITEKVSFSSLITSR